MNNVRFGTVMMIATPLVLAVVFGLLCSSEYKHREAARAEETQQQQNVVAEQHLLDEATAAPLINKEIAADDTPEEQAAFLNQLRVNAMSANVKLTQYTNMGQVMPARANNPGDSTPPPQQSIFRPVASTLTVQGTYPGVRAFAYSLLRSNRLMNMNGVTWKRDSDTDTTTLSFTLLRYVQTPTVQVTTTAAPTKPASGGGATLR